MTQYLIFDTILDATQFARTVGIRSGLGPQSLYPFARIENPETGQGACEVQDREAHRLTEAELAEAVDEADMDDVWFPGQEAQF